MNTERLGFIGLGSMGHPMARNLEKAGFSLSVYNRTKERTNGFSASTQVCSGIDNLVQGSDIIFTMLTNDAAVKLVYDEIGKQDVSGKLFVDMSTISPALSQEINEALINKGASLIDAPVAGSTKPATEGTLTIMAGGRTADVQRADPYFRKMGKLIKHLGGNGKGLAAKLAVNYFVSILYQGLAEAVLFSGKSGIERKDILEIINESATGSGATRVKTPLLVEENYQPAFTLDLMLKDILLATSAGANYPLSEVITSTYQSAHDAGFGQQDVIGVINHLSKNSG